MKKISVLIIALLLVASVGFADPVAVGSGALNVFGRIGLGGVSFAVNQIQESSARFDLLNNTLVQPNAAGFVVGDWEFSATNQSATVPYTITYTYGTLNSGTTTIAYEVLEYNGVTSSVKATGSTTTFTSTVGNYEIGRDIAVRLTAAGRTTAEGAPASENYNSTITIALTAN